MFKFSPVADVPGRYQHPPKYLPLRDSLPFKPRSKPFVSESDSIVALPLSDQIERVDALIAALARGVKTMTVDEFSDHINFMKEVGRKIVLSAFSKSSDRTQRSSYGSVRKSAASGDPDYLLRIEQDQKLRAAIDRAERLRAAVMDNARLKEREKLTALAAERARGSMVFSSATASCAISMQPGLSR